MKQIHLQGLGFILLSGIGWIIDFSVYLILTQLLGRPVGISNFISAVPSVTFVFFTSTRKIFIRKEGGVKLGFKYLIYICYQIVLVFLVSCLGQYMYDIFMVSSFAQIAVLTACIRIIIKIVITPITMVLNFITMKFLIERI